MYLNNNRTRGALYALAAVAAGAFATTGVQAQEGDSGLVTFGAVLTAEAANVQTRGSGTAVVLYNSETRELQWRIEFADLTTPATVAHFHGPAAQGANAGVALLIANADGLASSPVVGSAVLNETQESQLLAGQWYVNIHSQQYPGGEIRGHVLPGTILTADLAPRSGIASEGSGSAFVFFNPDNNRLSYRIAFSNLSGGNATNVRRQLGATGNVRTSTLGMGSAVFSPLFGTQPTALQAAHAAELLGGQWYITVSTQRFPVTQGGEILGQLTLLDVVSLFASDEAEAGDDSQAQAAPAVDADLLSAGTLLFATQCAACHGPAGAGTDLAPGLAGNGNLANASGILTQIVRGGSFMPPFSYLSNRDVAAVATFVRNSFGNAFGGVTEEQVGLAR